MKLNDERPTQGYSIRAYGPGSVTVRAPGADGGLEELHEGFILTPERLIRGWANHFQALEEAHFATLAGLRTELVLFGSGSRLRFPDPRLSAPLLHAGIGLEVMDTGAACRTYNLLLAEGRSVACALLMLD